MHITKWKEPIWKGYILFDTKYMTFWESQNYGDSKKARVFQELEAGWGEGWIGEAQRIAGAFVWYCHDGYKSLYFRPHPERRNTESEAYRKLWGWDVDGGVGRGHGYMRRGIYGNSVPSPQFCCDT